MYEPIINPVKLAHQAINEGGQHLLQVLPAAIRSIIEERLWVNEIDAHGKPFNSFEAFVVHPLWQGLECTISDLLHYCRKRPDVQELIQKEVKGVLEHGANRHTSRDMNPTSRNRASEYDLKRLKRDNPEIAERVIIGELSAHRAAVMAGIKKPRWSAPEEINELSAAISKKYPGWKLVKEV